MTEEVCVAELCAELGEVSHATGATILHLLDREMRRATSNDVKKHLALLALIIAGAKLEAAIAAQRKRAQ